MDPRRNVNDPKVRHIGFFAPQAPPDRCHSVPMESTSPPPLATMSPASNSLSPVMIPPPRHASDTLVHRRRLPPPPSSPAAVLVGSYNPSESLLATSPTQSPPPSASSSNFAEGEFSLDSPNWIRRSGSGNFASSFPRGGFDLTASKPTSAQKSGVSGTTSTKKAQVAATEAQSGKPVFMPSSKPLKQRTTRAERRALQESQRAAKSGRGGGSKASASTGGAAAVSEMPMETSKQPAQKKDGPPVSSPVAAPERKGAERQVEKDRKKEVPPPRMQFDDKNRVEKAKRRAVVKQTEARNRVELFRHLPQYEHGSQLPDLETRFFQLDPMHPAVHKVGLQYLAGDVIGGNARCIAMLQAFEDAIKDYSTPPEKTLTRDLTAKISSYVSFLSECRPLSVSMGNAIRFLKSHIAKLSLSLSESEAKSALCSDINRFINEKIILADNVIVRHAATKVRDGDVLLTYGSSCVVEMLLLHAHELGRQFSVVIVDSRPKLEGQGMLRRLVAKGLSCTYTHINAVSYIMHEVSRVFLGAASVLSNGTVYSRVGTSCVAMVAHAFHVPVLICCEAYKFHERVQLDSICSNELGDPEAISKVPGRRDVNCLGNWAERDNLQLLNLVYDATPSDYISLIVTDYGMVPPTSVPVIVRDYRREKLWM